MKNNYLLGLAMMLLFFALPSQAQVRTVSGVLVDPNDGTPLPGVSILVKGTNRGTSTNAQGYYELQAPVGATLVISSIGYTTQEVLVTPFTGKEGREEKQRTGPINLPKIEPATIKTFRHTIPDSPEDKTLSPYFFVQSDNPSVDAMPLKSTSASVNISGVIAQVTVKQVYVNEGKNVLEAIYIFPGSTRAAVYGMSMQVGNRRIVAKIKEKMQARQEYEQAIEMGKTATLLEQKRPNVFQMNVGNILPKDTITVELLYTELLLAKEGTYEFVYPTVVGPRYSETPDDRAHKDEQWVQNPYLSEGKAPTYTFDLKTRLNAGLPIQKVFSPSHQVHIAFTDKNTAQVQLAPTDSLGGNRDYILQYRLRGGKIESGLLLSPGQDENFFLLMLQPPDRPTPEQVPPREYVFIVDVSGSMNGFPLDVSKQLMRKLLGNLRSEDRFNVILFAGTSNIFSADESVPATENQVSHAMRFIDAQQGSGGTSLLPALERALALKGTEDYARTFVLVTDGYVEVEKQAFDLVKRNLHEANFFAFGIGSSVNRYLMEGLANAGMGEPFFVTTQAEAKKVSEQFRELIESPVLMNIKLDYGGMDVYDVVPASIPDVFVERPIVVFGKYKGVPKGTITLSGISGQSVYTQALETASARSDNNQALRYLWARERIKYWDDYAQFFEGDVYKAKMPHQPHQQKAITELGLKYNLLTAYTSFIAVDSIIRTQQQPIEVKQPLPLPQGVSNSALQGTTAGVQIRGCGSVMGLTPDIKSLSEVVVVGYGTQKRHDITCAVSTVQSRDQLAPNSSVEQALQGKVSGVIVTQNSGSPGGSTSVRIRGNTSASINNGPLYVVDGIVVDNGEADNGIGGFDNANRVADIPTDDIESIQVLKGASASAIYGSRGAQGVVLMTTKTGRNARGKYPAVTITSSVASEGVNKLPGLQHDFAQGQPIHGFATWQGSNEPFSWGPKVSDLVVTDKGELAPKGTGNGLSAPTYASDEFLRHGLTMSNSIHIGHNKEKYHWSIGLGNYYRRSPLPGSDVRKNTVRLTAERQLGKWKLGISGWYISSNSSQFLRGNDPSGLMMGVLSTPATYNNAAGYQWGDATPRRASDWYDNPYWSSRKNGQQTGLNRVLGRFEATYALTQHLQMKYDIQADRYTDERYAGVDRYSASQPSGRMMQRKEDFLHWQSSLMLNYDRALSDFELHISSGLTYRKSQRLVNRTDGIGLLEAGSFSPENVSVRTTFRQNFEQDNYSLLTKASLSWQSKVNLDLRMLNEWTSTIQKKHLLSPSVGVSAQLTDLFAIQNQVLTSGKVYTSYAQIQKEAPLFIDPAMLLARTLGVTEGAYRFERQTIEGRNPLRPESNGTWELGTDLQFFNGNVSLQAVHYRTRTRHLYIPLFDEPSVRLQNGGSLLNKGWEIDLTGTILRTNQVTWSSTVHFTKAQSIVQSLDVERVALAGFQSISSNLIAGQPYGVLYGTRYLRNEQGQLVIDTDGFPIVDSKPGILGSPNPNWVMGIENRLQWKSWEFSFLFDFRKGGVVWNGTRNALNYLGISRQSGEQRSTTAYVFEGVTTEGKPNEKAINFVDNQALENNRWVRYGRSGVAEDAIEDTSWLRLRTIRLTYTFNRDFLRRIHLHQLSVSMFAQNLWLSTRYSGIDPETNLTGNSNGNGLDYFNTPNVRSIGASLRIGF